MRWNIPQPGKTQYFDGLFIFINIEIVYFHLLILRWKIPHTSKTTNTYIWQTLTITSFNLHRHILKLEQIRLTIWRNTLCQYWDGIFPSQVKLPTFTFGKHWLGWLHIFTIYELGKRRKKMSKILFLFHTLFPETSQWIAVEAASILRFV